MSMIVHSSEQNEQRVNTPINFFLFWHSQPFVLDVHNKENWSFICIQRL